MKLPKKPKQRSMKAITTELWKICRELTFKKHGRDCYTCSQKRLTGLNLQCGHAYPKGALGALMAYDLRILRPQCFRCNINYGGMQATFWKNLERDLGKKDADFLYLECQRSKGKPVNARNHYTDLIKTYHFIYA